MRPSFEKSLGRLKAVHRHQWLWEPLETEPTCLLRTLVGAKAVNLDGKRMNSFCAREEPWRGLLPGTDQPRHAPLQAEFPELTPHPILPRWLYLPETSDRFERSAVRIVATWPAGAIPASASFPSPRNAARALSRRAAPSAASASRNSSARRPAATTTGRRAAGTAAVRRRRPDAQRRADARHAAKRIAHDHGVVAGVGRARVGEEKPRTSPRWAARR